MQTLLVMTGPQGSGNHLWSKILAQTPEVQGWYALSKKYWINHTAEPFSELWQNPSLFQTRFFPDNYYVTSISCPYTRLGKQIEDVSGRDIPKYKEFIEQAKSKFNVKVAIIGREANILNYQQQRLRKASTTPQFIEQLDVLMSYDPIFISTELLYLYKLSYIKQVSKLLDFPISIDSDKLEEILKDNSNLKYIRPVEYAWLDDELKGKNYEKNIDIIIGDNITQRIS